MKIESKSKLTIFEQIVNQMIEYISLGVYKPCDKLPSIRELSSQLNVNPNTIQKAYRELERQGFIYSIVAKGVYVSEVNHQSQKITKKMLQKTIRHAVVQSFYIGIDEDELHSLIREEFERSVKDNDRNQTII